jgi:hypothetical protein
MSRSAHSRCSGRAARIPSTRRPTSGLTSGQCPRTTLPYKACTCPTPPAEGHMTVDDPWASSAAKHQVNLPCHLSAGAEHAERRALCRILLLQVKGAGRAGAWSAGTFPAIRVVLIPQRRGRGAVFDAGHQARRCAAIDGMALGEGASSPRPRALGRRSGGRPLRSRPRPRRPIDSRGDQGAAGCWVGRCVTDRPMRDNDGLFVGCT